VSEVLEQAKKAKDVGVMVLCIHADADDRSDNEVYTNKIQPAFQAVEDIDEDVCKNLVAVVPIYMTEAWMLADVNLLVDVIGTDKSINDLELNREPESVSDPKQIIKNAIRIAFEDQTRRKRGRSLSISELYLPIGQRIHLHKLERLSSYRKFKEGVRNAYRRLNYLH
jgi:hypothetical protein